ncbi:MAG: multicopper oxidase domain-containing protein [Desulfobacterales bacterium]|jgi:FtsP/CotA-like multicopper oxidase with cupredoxin domain|nr:multicopper oxidase domain-containing protein [Desulfobacterales bacterium]
MKDNISKIAVLGALTLYMALSLLIAGSVQAMMPGMIDGITGPDFTLTAKSGHISTPEGNSVYFWGFANATGTDTPIVQYPGPTLIVNQGDSVTVALTNTLPVNVSIVFPGQGQVTTDPVATNAGLLAEEVPPGGSVTYSFTAAQPGTYLYHSGTQTDLQMDMGLFGALIVRPSIPMQAYNHPDSAYDGEYLFLLSEMDPKIHRLVEIGRMDEVDTTTFFPGYWFINGRCAPDTMFAPFVSWLPNQPYNCMPMMEPGQKILLRVIGAGRDLHPLHHHGNHSRVIARDGRLLESSAGQGTDLSYEVFTVQSVPGQTVDAIFTWTGAGMGWDIYGHGPDDPMAPGEDPNDHGKPFPVLLPETGDLAFGGFWSGSPFLGALGGLPPGEGGLNPMGGFTYMLHSHTEKEMTNNDIFPGGMMTMLIVTPPGGSMMALPLEQGENPIMGKEGGN